MATEGTDARMANDDDTTLVLRARRGDKDAFGVLVDRYEPMAARIARRLVANREVARELAQEALLHAWLSLDRLRDASRFESWLYGIVLNVCRGHRRARREDHASLEALTGGVRLEAAPLGSGSFEPDPHDVAEAQELHGTVLRAVDTLSPKTRAATLLFYYDQLTVREVAATLGISVAAVKGRLHKARNRLRDLLADAQPGHAATNSDEEERRMIDVEVIDVLDWKTVRDEGGDGEGEKPGGIHVVVMYDAAGRRMLPIWIGPSEAQSIATALRDVETPRPGTHAFAVRMLESVGARLEEGRVERLAGTTFYGVATVRCGDDVREIDARPSDAIAMAAHSNSPVRVAEEVMDKAGVRVEKPPVEGKGLDSIAAKFHESQPAAHSKEQAEKSQAVWEDSLRTLTDFLAG